jgi:hypothetical protein
MGFVDEWNSVQTEHFIYIANIFIAYGMCNALYWHVKPPRYGYAFECGHRKKVISGFTTCLL